MKCKIIHESGGRMRVHLNCVRMSLRQADVLEFYLKNVSGVTAVAVYDRTQDAVIRYGGSRAAVVQALARFSFDRAEAMDLVPEHTSRALNRELRRQGVGVMAVCPFWTKTAFFDRAIREGEQPIVKKYVAMYDVEDIVTRTWRDAKRGKDVCKYGFIARAQAGLAKILPHSLVMDVWMKQQELR